MSALRRTEGNPGKLEVEVRIGVTAVAASHGLARITANARCGAAAFGFDFQAAAEAVCGTPLTGQYLSLQTLSRAAINLAEVNVFVTGRREQVEKEPFSL